MPPPTGPPTTPTSGPPGPTPPPRGRSAGLTALAAFLGVCLVGGAVWFFALRPSGAEPPPTPPSPTVEPTDQPTTGPTVEPTTGPTVEPTTGPTVEPTVEPTEPPTTAPPTQPPTTAPTVEPTTEPPPPPPPTETAFNLNVCASVGPQGRCIRPGFVRPANSPRFVVLLAWQGTRRGEKVAIDYISTDTGLSVAQTNSFTLNQPAGFLTVEFRGPFPRIEFEIVVSYKGKPLRWDRPPVVRLV